MITLLYAFVTNLTTKSQKYCILDNIASCLFTWNFRSSKVMYMSWPMPVTAWNGKETLLVLGGVSVSSIIAKILSLLSWCQPIEVCKNSQISCFDKICDKLTLFQKYLIIYHFFSTRISQNRVLNNTRVLWTQVPSELPKF